MTMRWSVKKCFDDVQARSRKELDTFSPHTPFLSYLFFNTVKWGKVPPPFKGGGQLDWECKSNYSITLTLFFVYTLVILFLTIYLVPDSWRTGVQLEIANYNYLREREEPEC